MQFSARFVALVSRYQPVHKCVGVCITYRVCVSSQVHHSIVFTTGVLEAAWNSGVSGHHCTRCEPVLPSFSGREGLVACSITNERERDSLQY